MSDPVEQAAEAILRAEDRLISQIWAWDELHEETQAHYLKLARAAIDALGLTEEWAAGSAGGFGHAWDSKPKAQRSLATILSNNARYRARTGRDPDWGEDPYIASRLVSPWVRVGEETNHE